MISTEKLKQFIDYREFSHNLDKEIDMKKIRYSIDRFMKDFFRVHVVLVHSPDDNSGISIEGVLSVHIGGFAAERRVKKLRARRPEGIRFQFIALELGRVKTPYCFDEWLPEYVAPWWRNRKRNPA